VAKKRKAKSEPKEADAIPRPSTDIPETRQHATPPVRPSVEAIDLIAPMHYPDDGNFSGLVRKLDGALGTAEQAALFALLAAIVLVAATAALSDKILHAPIGRWWFVVVRGGTFSIAMIGAAFATQQQRHLAMDLVSRQLSPRGRLILGLVLKLFVIAICILLFKSGLHQRDTVGESAEQFVSDKTVVSAMPLGAALIIIHSLFHFAIEVDYLARGKLLPERARSGH
jgi:TRAP-type C4-dicarboxylate transport system permease small subunit